MRADWTASGACTSGSTAPPRGATRRASGGATTTSTTSAEPSLLSLVVGIVDATAGREVSRRMVSERASKRAFFGAALAAIEMQQPALARAVPIVVGVVVLIAGSLQLTAWKARR